MAPVATADYLAAELRTELDQLVEDVATHATSVENVRPRARLLWKWVNAFALNGGYVPVNLTQAVSSVLAYPLGQRANRYPQIDNYVRELALRDREPDAIGELSAIGGPFEAGSFGTLVQTYRVGTRSISTGGGFLIARHMMPGYGFWQVTDPAGDNYISIASSNPDVEFSPTQTSMSGMHGGFRGGIPTLVFAVTSGSLYEDDVVTITYGDTSGGGRGLRMPTMSSDFIPFPIYLALDAGGHFLSLPIQPVGIYGTTLSGVHAFAPSIVKAGEPFAISVRGQDDYFNRATTPHPTWHVYFNDERVLIIPTSDEAIAVRKVAGLEPGVYHVRVEADDGSIQGSGNPILVEHEASTYIYWGDTHGHSGFAEGIGSPEQFMEWAKHDAYLDFVTHSEHDIWMDDHEWEVLRANVERFSDERFIAYLGYEWTVQGFMGGHHNVLFRTPTDRQRVPAQTHGSLSKLYHGLRTYHDPIDVVVIPHAHQSGDYRLSDPELQPLVEIMSQHGNFEWFGRMYLQQGHQVGFTAASDNHLAQPGYTSPRGASLAQKGGLGALLSAHKSRDSLFDAMKDLASYATTGDRMILRFAVNGARMGQRTQFSEERKLEGRVIGTEAIDEITVVKNGTPIWQERYREAGELTASGTFQLSFSSTSNPLHAGDNPRGWRPWRGTVEVTGATLDSFRVQDFANTNEYATSEDANVILFATRTRGDDSSILLELSDVTPASSVVVTLDKVRETGGGPPFYRRHQALSASRVELNFADAVDGQITQPLPISNYVDHVKLRRVVTDGERDVSFTFVDQGRLQGDYYYVRVTQANDAVAWSSPVWVGGFPAR